MKASYVCLVNIFVWVYKLVIRASRKVSSDSGVAMAVLKSTLILGVLCLLISETGKLEKYLRHFDE